MSGGHLLLLCNSQFPHQRKNKNRFIFIWYTFLSGAGGWTGQRQFLWWWWWLNFFFTYTNAESQTMTILRNLPQYQYLTGKRCLIIFFLNIEFVDSLKSSWLKVIQTKMQHIETRCIDKSSLRIFSLLRIYRFFFQKRGQCSKILKHA